MTGRILVVSSLAVFLLAATACRSETQQVGPSITPESASYSTPGGQSVEVSNHTADGLALVNWAFARFEVAGLVEPTVREIDFGHGDPGCEDAAGWAVLGVGDESITMCLDIDRICRHVDGAAVFTVVGRVCILHELSHLWLSQNVTEPAHSEFMELTGANNWRDPDTPWSERGVEQAADTIAWGLLGERIEILGRPLPSCELLHDAFLILTDTAPTSSC